jgi:hypothetical protein
MLLWDNNNRKLGLEARLRSEPAAKWEIFYEIIRGNYYGYKKIEWILFVILAT